MTNRCECGHSLFHMAWLVGIMVELWAVRRLSVRPSDQYRETIDPYRDCPEAEMRDAQASVAGQFR